MIPLQGRPASGQSSELPTECTTVIVVRVRTPHGRSALSFAARTRRGRALGAAHISSGHYLFGLIAEGDGLGAKALRTLNVCAEDVKDCLTGDSEVRSPAVGHVPVADEAKDALRAAGKLSRGGDIGSDHILLGLVMSPDRAAARIVSQNPRYSGA